MVLRVVVALGGLTFMSTGIAVALSDTCRSVVWGTGGGERAGRFSATCVDTFGAGMPQATAAALAIGIGAVLLVWTVVPLLMRLGTEEGEVSSS